MKTCKCSHERHECDSCSQLGDYCCVCGEAPHQEAKDALLESWSISPPSVPSAVSTVVATLALAPFVQAIASTLGARVATKLDEVTRSALRRFFQRQLEEARPGRRTARTDLELLVKGDGVSLRISRSTPPALMSQLPTIDFDALRGSQETNLEVSYSGIEWRAFGTRDSRPFTSTWDSANGQWRDQSEPGPDIDVPEFLR
jgi:hypothetical protein